MRLPKIRKRTAVLIGGSIIVIGSLLLTDPDNGAMTLSFLQQLVTPIIAVWFAYIARKALFDYLDMEELFSKAKETALGSAVIFLATCIVFFGLLGLFGNSARAEGLVATYIPENAYVYKDTLKTEMQTYWPDHPKNIYLPV